MRRRLHLISLVAAAATAVVPGAAAETTPCQPGAGPIAADPSAAGGVNVHLTASGSVQWCSAQAIEANSDVADGTNYPVQATSQSPNYNPVSNAISVGGLLTLAGVNPAATDHLAIMRLNGSWSTLDRADLVDPSSRFESGLRPIFWINGSETQYLRPLRGPADTNGDDQIVASSGAPLELYLYSGPVLTVTAGATPATVAVRQPVTFTATVSHATAADGPLRYTWDFQDGSTASGPSVRHSYSVAGKWYPVVTVLGRGNDSGGASRPIAVTVGAAATGRAPGSAGGTKPSRHAGGSGPIASNGTTPKAAPARARTGPQTTPAPAPAASAANPTPARPAGAGRRAAAPVTRPAGYGRAPRRIVRQQLGRGGTVVRGRLIADLIPISAVQLAQHHPVEQAYAAAAPSGGGSISPLAGLAGSGVILALLGCGAAVEVRSRRRALSPARPAGP
jgi:hypothetical protein